MKNKNCHTWIWFSTELAQYRRNEIGNSENRQKIMCVIFKNRSNGEEQMFQFMPPMDKKYQKWSQNYADHDGTTRTQSNGSKTTLNVEQSPKSEYTPQNDHIREANTMALFICIQMGE